MGKKKEAWCSHLAPWLIELHQKHSESCGGPEITAKFRELLSTDPKIIKERAFLAREKPEKTK